MFCTQCGKTTANGAKFCGHCGGLLSEPASQLPKSIVDHAPAEASPTPQEAEEVTVRPWVRYWGRMFDVLLASIVISLVFGILYPEAFEIKGADQLLGLLVVFLWVFVESILLSTIGTTPGKWLLRTQIIPRTGLKPNFSKALSRSFMVWWRGMGIGFPLASLITLIVAHGKLTKGGITTWDRDGGFTVVHQPIGLLRIAVATVFFIGFLALAVLGSASDV